MDFKIEVEVSGKTYSGSIITKKKVELLRKVRDNMDVSKFHSRSHKLEEHHIIF